MALAMQARGFETECASLIGTLHLPDSSTRALGFSNNIATIPVTQQGMYIAEVTALKEGYHNETIDVRFEVIDRFSRVIDLSYICNPPDGTCGRGENHVNCPQDCSPEELPLGLRKLVLEIEKWAESKAGALDLAGIIALINAWRESYSV